MSKKSFLIGGIVTGLLAILFGVLIMSESFGGKTSTDSGASYLYDSGYASFGADFYTYVSNNAQEAASAARTTARNLDQIALLLKSSLGLLFIVFGMFTTCLFGAKLFDGKALPAAADTKGASAAAPAGPAPANPEALRKEEESPAAEVKEEPLAAAEGKAEEAPAAAEIKEETT